jgi:hypothetical protein
MKTLELFNAVVAKPSAKGSTTPFVSEDGYIIEPSATWAKDRIVKFYNEQKLSGNDLNKTFHKSFEKVRNSSRFELFMEQIRHYASTYGSNFTDEVYIPDEVLDVPDVKLTFKVVKALEVNELVEKCLNLLRSGIALKEETIDTLLSILVDELGYTFTGKEGIKNKEAIVKIADTYGVVPDDTMEFFRYVIYRATGDTLLIKNPVTIQKIKASGFNPSAQFRAHGLDRLARIFNRFKPLFLAFKAQCPATINKVSKLSKTNHKPLAVNALSEVTQRLLTKDDVHWLDNATTFALFKAASAVYNRMQGQSTFCYRIRNGKSYVKEGVQSKTLEMMENFQFILSYLKTRHDLTGQKFFLPEDVQYALPTSEKMFVGNIPTGTKFFGEKLCVGIYWEDAWGARDLDLSACSIGGSKIGWNRDYSNESLTYSGDITSAPNGAVEYLHCQNGTVEPWLVQNNVFSGNEEGSGYKIIVGRGSYISRQYMMDPNNLFAEVKTESVQRQMVLGLFLPEQANRQSFVLLNFGAGQARVSVRGGLGAVALHEQYKNPLDFKTVIEALGAEVVYNSEDADHDLSLNNLEKDSFTKLFE